MSGMLKAFKRGLQSSSMVKEAAPSGEGWGQGADVEEEVGSWRYLVVDDSGIKPREDPSYSTGRKVGKDGRIQEGQIVEVVRRRKSGWTKWLMLSSGNGWIFDISPKDNKVRAVEVEVLEGFWQYQVCSDGVLALPRPSQSKDAKYRAVQLARGEIVTVSTRIRMLNSKGAYLCLEDRRGFALDFVGGVQVLQRLPDPGQAALDGTAPAEQHAQCNGAATPFQEGGSRSSMSGQGRPPGLPSGSGGYGGGGPAPFPRQAPQGGGYGGGAFDTPSATSFSSSWRGPDLQGGARSPQNSSEQPKLTLQRSSSPRSIASTTCSTMSPGLNGANMDLGAPEVGEWTYMVVDPGGITLREKPTFSSGSKSKDRVKRGEIVKVVERRLGNGSTFVRLESPRKGWAFDTQPASALRGQRLRMYEVATEEWCWRYRVVAPSGVALRSRCSFDESAKIGQGPIEGEIVTVVERLVVGGTNFLRLASEAGREGGWIFDTRDGRTMVEGPITVKTFPEETYGVVTSAEGVHLWKAPTLANGAQTSLFMLQGAKLQLKEAVVGPAGCDMDQQWVRVAKPGGIEGWLPQGYLDMLIKEETPPSPTARRGNFSADQVRQALHAPNPLAMGAPAAPVMLDILRDLDQKDGQSDLVCAA